MTWPFENDTGAITKKLANKSLKSEKRRNLMVVIAVALAAFLICFTGIVATSLTQMHGSQVGLGLPCGFAEENRGCYPISCCGICAR